MRGLAKQVWSVLAAAVPGSSRPLALLDGQC
jgi:hypothetical protein